MSRLTHKDFNGNYYSYTTQGNYIEGCFTRENKEWFYGNVVNKLGKLEDIFELIEEMYNKPVCWKGYDGEEEYEYYTHSTILYNPKTNEIEIYEYEFITSYKVEEYGITWWMKEEVE